MMWGTPGRQHNHARGGTEAQLYRALLAQASDLAAIVAANGTFRYASPSYLRILGYSPADLHERSVFEHVHPDDLPRVQAAFTAALQSEGIPVTVPRERADQQGEAAFHPSRPWMHLG